MKIERPRNSSSRGGEADAAIQKPVGITGLPRRYAPRNDENPGATEYAIQIWEQAGLGPWGGREALFDWDSRPVMREPAANLADYGVVLKPGHYYSIDITAQTGAWQPVSTTSRQLRAYDFRVVEPGGGG